MNISLNLYYYGQNGNAQKFANEMINSGLVDRIRNESGNLKYEYYVPFDDPETLLLIDEWENQYALDVHHKSSMMKEITILREQYNLHMKVQKLHPVNDELHNQNERFIRK